MTNKKISPPFGYFGSKNRLALELCKDLPPHNCWVEAFCGSAAMTLAKKPAKIEIINDIDKEIVNFFKQLRNKPQELIRVLELTPYAAQELFDARVVDYKDSEIERARKFAVQAMMAINGSFGVGKGGFSVSHSYSRNNKEARVNRWNNLPKRLGKVIERLKDVRIENKDARELIKSYLNRPASLIYLDPPYLAERVNGYNKEANDFSFHENLLEQINSARCMVFISGYTSELYDTVLSPENGWQKQGYNANTKGTNGVMHNRTEFVWMNKYYIDAVRKKQLPIFLTEKEKKINKVNPER